MLREAITVNTQPKNPALPTPKPALAEEALTGAAAPLRGASAALSALDDKLETLRGKLPPVVQNAVKRVPTRMLFGAVAGVVGLALLGVLVAVSSGPSDSGTTTPSPSASTGAAAEERKPAKEGPFARPDELADAKAGGQKAFEALQDKYPKDPNIGVEQARDLATKKDYSGAVAAVGRALSIDSAFQNNAQVASLVFQTAQVKASSDAAFALLEGGMGARGADIAYDLVTTPNVRQWVQSRAETFLQSAGFEKVASPGLRAIVKLRYSAGCDEKRALLADLKKNSDERALFELVPLQDKTGCGARKKDDCYPCLRTSNDLDDAITAVRGRKR